MDVAGHDDHPLSQYACPPVTTVAQNDDEIDRLTIRMAGAVREIALPAPVTLLYPRSRQLSPRVRVFIDWVAALFRA